MKARRVWIDFENTPHVLFLEPLLRRLLVAGWECVTTARPQAQTVDLAAARGIHVVVVGRGDRSGQFGKIAAVLHRAELLARWARHQRPALLVSSSRAGSIAARLMGIPAVGLLDYEHAEQFALAVGCRAIWLPDLLASIRLPLLTRRVARYYAGLKENLYLDDWPLDRSTTRRRLGIEEPVFLVVARPPAETAHYANDLSSHLWVRSVRQVASWQDTAVIVTARTRDQRQRIAAALAGVPSVRCLEDTVNGPELVAAADLVIGGGGTMNREAAVLGVPVWSVFTGPPAEIDEQLAREERLCWVRSTEQLHTILHRPRPSRRAPRGPVHTGLEQIMSDVLDRLEN